MGSAEVRAMVDSPTFRGGVSSRYGASVQPARLARGLRRVLMEHGRAHPRAHARDAVRHGLAGDRRDVRAAPFGPARP